MKQTTQTITIGIAILIMLVMLTPLTLAEPQILKVNLWIAKNNTITPQNIKATIGFPDQEDPAGFDYKLIWADRNNTLYSTGIYPNFRRIDTTEDVEHVFITQKLPYRGNIGKLRVSYFNGTRESVLWSYDLRKLCNRDKICNTYENYLSCPSDCNLKNKDNVCIPQYDTICDPDCAPELDRDCFKEPISPTVITSIALVILFFILILLYYKKKPKKRKRR